MAIRVFRSAAAALPLALSAAIVSDAAHAVADVTVTNAAIQSGKLVITGTTASANMPVASTPRPPLPTM